MLSEIGALLLKSDLVIIPYETIAGNRQVSSLVLSTCGRCEVYNLQCSNKDVGPVGLSRHAVPDEEVAQWLATHSCAEIRPADVRMTWHSFWCEDQIEAVIAEIVLLDLTGHRLTLRSEGAAYPYGLVIVD